MEIPLQLLIVLSLVCLVPCSIVPSSQKPSSCEENVEITCYCGMNSQISPPELKVDVLVNKWKTGDCDKARVPLRVSEKICSKLQYCLTCSEKAFHCLTCPRGRYGKYCHKIQPTVRTFGNHGKLRKRDVTYPSPQSHCPAVKVPEGAYVEGNCLNGWEGSNCTFHCFPGYYLVGEPTLQCHDNAWSSDSPVCKPIPAHCEPLSAPENGQTYGPCDLPEVGDRCSFSCVFGHVLTGERVLTCQKDHQWSGTPPECIRPQKKCDALEAPKNGYHLGNCLRATTGLKCDFGCFPGFVLEGDKNLTCEKGGQWSSEAPKCVVRPWHCETLPPPEDGSNYMDCVTATVGQKCHFSCNYGYVLNGEKTLICEKGFKWSEEPPTCEIPVTECPALTTPINGIMSGHCHQRTLIGRKCHINCLPGFRIDGASVLTCEKSGSWSSEVPECKNKNKFPG